MVGNVKNRSVRKDDIIVASIVYIRVVWLLSNLSLDGKLCLRNDKNASFV